LESFGFGNIINNILRSLTDKQLALTTDKVIKVATYTDLSDFKQSLKVAVQIRIGNVSDIHVVG